MFEVDYWLFQRLLGGGSEYGMLSAQLITMSFIGWETSKEFWTSKSVDFNNLRIFVCPTFVHESSDK